MKIALIAKHALSKSPIWLRKIGLIASKNSPAILTGLGVVGVVGTVIFASQASIKANDTIKAMKADRQVAYENNEVDTPEVSKKEIAKAVAPIYIPTVLTGAVTIGCIIGANSINSKRQAVMAGLYSASEAALREYQQKVVEKVGEEGDREIRNAIAKDKVDKQSANSPSIPVIGTGGYLCFDSLSGRLFRSSRDWILKTVNETNRMIIGDMWVTLNEFYGELGLDPIPLGESIGWNVDRLLEIDISGQIESETGEPCIVLNYPIMPVKFDWR